MPQSHRQAVSPVEDLLKLARELVESVEFDNNGAIIGGQYRGGNGGLISPATIVATDRLRRQLDAFGAAPLEPSTRPPPRQVL